ncbi:recombinase RecF, partial [Clostridium botulinum]|nr:recombinase RecF [Clostridium botulinum]
KVELLESSINSKFKYVSFKLFDTQVNGGLNETCEALINGVPFSNANTASQINAGLDIINALSEHYSVQAPIFIDNRESINNLIDINSQIINLIVSKDKNLRVEVM